MGMSISIEGREKMSELQLLEQADNRAAVELIKRLLDKADKNAADFEPTMTTEGRRVLAEAYDRMSKDLAEREKAFNEPFRIDRDDPDGRFLLEAVIEMEDYADIAARPTSASREQLELMAGCYTRVFHDLRDVLGLDD
jgi:hypothetical protein